MKKIEYDFVRYLAAKKNIDDRALNGHVRDRLCAELPNSYRPSPLQILELGAGIGTMAERLIDWGLLAKAKYTAVDADSANIRKGRNRLNSRAATGQFTVDFICEDIYQFFNRQNNENQWDLCLAHAFLDLVDIADVVPRFCRLTKPGGLLYLTLNYDGETILLPAVDRKFDEQIMQRYNQSMDERNINGKKSGDSKTGRHLLLHLKNAGAEILAAGSSDWILVSGSGGYTADEAYFLHFIIHTIFLELKGHTSLNRTKFNAWARLRHEQIENNELIFIAKQTDVLARIGSQ